MKMHLELLNLLFHSLQISAHGWHGVQFALKDIHPVEHALWMTVRQRQSKREKE